MTGGGPLVVDLDDQAALDPFVVGAKAAWLARARRAELPVLPGIVVTAAASDSSIGLGLERLRSGGSGWARMAVTKRGLPEGVAGALAQVDIEWNRLVVRSSSALEATGEWSGIFASYPDVGPDDLAKAIVGCWASAFSVTALETCQRAGKTPTAMAVILQPWLEAAAGGTIEVTEATVAIHSVDGSPAGLFSGRRRGRSSIVDRASGAIGGYRDSTIENVADLALMAHERTGASSMEWVVTANHDPFLVQLSKRTLSSSRAPDIVELPEHPDLMRVARILRRFPGALGADLMLPWALGVEDPATLDVAVHVAVVDPATALAEARIVARALTSYVWGSSAALAPKTLAELAGDPGRVLGRIERLRSPPTDAGTRLVGLLQGVGIRLRQQGVLGHPDEVWYLEPDDPLSRRLRLGTDRWEPLGAAVTSAQGVRRRGLAASDGIGFGQGSFVDDVGRAAVGPRRVIIAKEPIPHLSPLLWSAAGLVTLDGSPGAHLFGAARSLGVPAVTVADIDATVVASGMWAVAVDGTNGLVSISEW